MRRTITLMTALGLLAALAVAGPLTAKPGNKFDSATVTHECSNAEGEITLVGALTLWPPNHKYQPYTITATADDDSAEVVLATVGTHDEFLEDGTEMQGAGNTENDVHPMEDDDMGTGSATTGHQIRAERSGQGDGRTYTISALATFDGQPCEVDMGDEVAVDFTIFVPHDMRGGASWK